MSEPQHTPESLIFTGQFFRDNKGAIIGSMYGNDSDRLTEPYMSTSKRITASYNACAGIPTEALEAGVVQDLVEALKSFAGLPYFTDNPQYLTIVSNAKQALAKLEDKPCP